MTKLFALAALAGSAAAFAPAPVCKAPKASATALSVETSSVEMSRSLPFLRRPKNLEGWIGDVGFDPLGFSDTFDMKWLREAEIKHGRVSMLATVGFVTSQFMQFPMYADVAVEDSNLAPSAVGAGVMLQIVFAAGFEEWRTNDGNITMETMFADPDRVPGEIGFDPANFLVKSSKEDMDNLRLQEIKNGRLAMLAIGGMIHHNWITGEPLL